MRTKQDNMTPREAAYLIATAWLHCAYNKGVADIEEMDDRESVQIEIMRQVAKLHNKLCDHVSFDYLPLDEEIKK